MTRVLYVHSRKNTFTEIGRAALAERFEVDSASNQDRRGSSMQSRKRRHPRVVFDGVWSTQVLTVRIQLNGRNWRSGCSWPLWWRSSTEEPGGSRVAWGRSTLVALVKRLNDPVYRHRALQFIADAVIAALAFFLAFQLRFLDVAGGIPGRYWTVLWGSIGFVALGKAVIFTALGLNDKWWRYFYLRDFPQILRAVAVASAVLIVVFTVAQPFPEDVPRSVVVMDFLICLLLVFGGRMVSRFLAERPARSTRRRGQRESLVVGAGSGGQMVVREMHLNPNLGSKAIGFIDDDPRKRGMRLLGLKVMGSTDEIGGILDQTKPDEVIIAIPSAPGVLRGKVVAACREREIPVQTLPTVFELLRGGVQLTRQLREVQVEDVLGRDPVVMELDRVGAYLNDRIVLVTGAGGSIGSELSRQIARVRLAS